MKKSSTIFDWSISATFIKRSDQSIRATFSKAAFDQTISATFSNTTFDQTIRATFGNAAFDQAIRATFSNTAFDQTIRATFSYAAFDQTIRATFSHTAFIRRSEPPSATRLSIRRPSRLQRHRVSRVAAKALTAKTEKAMLRRVWRL